MNVRLAAQTLSYSVANSMEILMRNGDKTFYNASGTITFVKNFNKAFDIFNAKHPNSNNLFKRGLNIGNAEQIFVFLDYFSKYIKSITCGSKNILKSARHTGFLGFLINIETLHYFYDEFILKNKMKNILFFYFGQDLLESLFGRIRSMLGHNTNPTEEQLKGVTRQIINFDELKASDTANCRDELNILTVGSSTNKNKTIPIDENNQNFEEHITDEDDLDGQTIFPLNFKELFTIKLRAGTIEKKIRYAMPRCTHEQCANIFNNSVDKIGGIFYETSLAQRPTNDTVTICEIIFKIFMDNNDPFKFNFNRVYMKILNFIPFDELYAYIDFSHDIDHKRQFILLIIDEYIRIHATYSARLMTLQIHTKFIGKSTQKLKHHLGQ